MLGQLKRKKLQPRFAMQIGTLASSSILVIGSCPAIHENPSQFVKLRIQSIQMDLGFVRFGTEYIINNVADQQHDLIESDSI